MNQPPCRRSASDEKRSGRLRAQRHCLRVIDDFRAYVGSLGEAAGLVGWSGGANGALAMAARSEAVRAVATYDPVVNGIMDEQERAALGGAVARAPAGLGGRAGCGHARVRRLPVQRRGRREVRGCRHLRGPRALRRPHGRVLPAVRRARGRDSGRPVRAGCDPGARAGDAWDGHRTVPEGERAARGRERAGGTDTGDSRRGARGAVDASRGGRRGAGRVLRSGASAGATPPAGVPWS